MIEEATARLERPASAFRRSRRRRLVRDVELRRVAFAAQLQDFRRETLTLIAPSDLLPDVGELVLTHPVGAAAAVEPEPPASSTHAVGLAVASVLRGKPTSYAATAAWAASADELVTRGISNRPSLIIAELTALALTPIAIFRGPGTGEPE